MLAYKGNEHLAKLLLAAGEKRPFSTILSILEGVLAAPEDIGDPYAFTRLFNINDNAEAKEQLLALKQDMESGEDWPRPPRDMLEQLRALMRIDGLDGYFVPRSDEFRGEYVPLRTNRLSWLTGFTGSAGCAIVMRERAAFYTDGRYTLQARAEVDAKKFEILDITDKKLPPPSEWIAANLPRYGRFGIDAWLHSVNEVKVIKEALRQARGKLQTGYNLVDAVWKHHPPEPLSPAVPHPEKFSGRPSESKIDTLTAAMYLTETDALVLTMPEDICWLLNVRGGDVPNTPFVLSYAIVHRDGRVHWYVNPDKVTAETRDWVKNVAKIESFTFGNMQSFERDLRALALGGKKTWIDPENAPYAVEEIVMGARTSQDLRAEATDYELHRMDPDDKEKVLKQREEALRKSRLHYETSPVPRQKAMKNATEIDGAIRAHVRDGVAVTRFLAAMAEQGAAAKYTELSAAALLQKYRQENELFRGLSFDSIVGAGPNGAIIHYRSTPDSNLPLTVSPMFLVDSGAQYLDGTTDITRTICMDTPTPEMREHFTRVLKGHIQLSMAVFPEGTAGKDLDPLARAALKEVGLDYAHGTGHGVGSYMSVHEGPQAINGRSTFPLVPGMILSNEPGYYKEGEYGIRSENLIYVVDTEKTDAEGNRLFRFETLTLAPFDRNLIEPSLMTDEELKWLNDYHSDVRAKILPLVEQKDAKAAAWLQQATDPIRRNGVAPKPSTKFVL